MPKIFICYRREDSQDIAARIYDRLSDKYGPRSIVFDVDDVPIGVDFRQYLRDQVLQCDALLAIIGRKWVTITNKAGDRRLEDTRDHLRIEIESAVRESKPVVPVLVRNASMPVESDLPESLAFLAYINAARVASGKDFDAHVQRLINGLEYLLEQAVSVPAELARKKTSVEVSSRRRKPESPAREAKPEGGSLLLEQLKAEATSLLPNTTWKFYRGWWSLGGRGGLRLIRAKPSRNTLRVRVRKNSARRTRTKANADGWIYESAESIVHNKHELVRVLEVFRREWL